MQHLSEKQFEDYSRQQLQASELLTVTDHLSECDECRRRIESGMNTDAAFFALRAEIFREAAEPAPHLTTEQIAEYVDKNLSGEELQVCNDHLAACDRCALAVEDVRNFRNEIAPSLDRQYDPRPTSAPTESRTQTTLFPLFRLSPIPAFGGAALAVILLAIIGWYMFRKQSEQHPAQEIAVAPAPTSQPSSVPSPVPSATEPAPLVVQLNDGEVVLTLDREGKLSGADNLPSSYQNMVKKALVSQRIERSSQLKELTQRSSSLMGSSNVRAEFSLIDPVGTVLLTDRPEFRWSSLEGASYVVEVYDSKFNLAAKSLQLATNSWTTPQSLARGEIYSWQVKAAKDGQEFTSPRPPAPQAKFGVLDQTKANELAKAKRAYGSSHLTLALLYADAGLLKESEQQLRILLKANPNSELVRNLLRQVQTLQKK